MFPKVNKNYSILVLFFTLCFSFLMCQSGNVYSLMIDAQNVQAIAIYGESSDFGEGLSPNQLIFNVTNPIVVEEMILSIEFSTERDCLNIGARTDAHVYIKFNDDSIEVYDLFGSWSHLSKVGMRGSCYYISEQGRILFETNVQ